MPFCFGERIRLLILLVSMKMNLSGSLLMQSDIGYGSSENLK